MNPSAIENLGLLIEGIFYGTYVVLFILYLILWRRNNRGGGPLNLAQILLFGLCTLKLFLDTSTNLLAACPILAHGTSTLACIRPREIGLSSILILTLIDYLAQMILLYRCWIIWGRRWVVVAVPGSLALVTLGGGLALAGLIWNAGQGKIAYPYKLTGITILLTSRETRLVLGSSSHQSFHIATAMLIESGLLMLAFQFIFIISYQFAAVMIVSSATAQIYGIAPILLSIRAVTGSSYTYDEATGEALSLRFTHSGGTAARSTGPSMSAAGAQSRITNEPDDVSNIGGAADDTV